MLLVLALKTAEFKLLVKPRDGSPSRLFEKAVPYFESNDDPPLRLISVI